jgi:hypothetical protein
MDKIAVVFIQTEKSLSIENCITSFIENNPIHKNNYYCIHQTPIKNKINNITYYLIDSESYKFIEQFISIGNYDYLLLLPNQYIIETQLNLTDYLPYLNNNIYQLQFLHTRNPSANLQYIINTPEFRYDSYKQIFNNPRPDTSTDVIDYNSYSQHRYNSIFKLVPSILNVKHIELKRNIPIFSNTIYQRYYNNVFFRNHLSSVSIEIPIEKNECLSNVLTVEKEVTVVTGFIKVNNASKKHKYDYVECAKKTLSLPNPMVIYISEDLYEDVKKFRTELGLIDKTRLIVLTVEDFYMYKEKSILDKCCAKNNSPYNNSLYIMSVNSRYSYMEKAIENNYFNTDYFAWVDFGISHIVEMNNIRPITYHNPLKVRIAWIARKNLQYNHKCLGGGIFVAHKDTMKILCKLHDIEFKYNLSLGHCVNDDKTLFFIFLNNPELFDIYFSGYNCLYDKIFTC